MYCIPYLLDQKPRLLIILFHFVAKGGYNFERGHCWREPSITLTTHAHTVLLCGRSFWFIARALNNAVATTLDG